MTERFQNTAQPDRDWWSALWPEPADTVRRLGLDEDDRALDVCSGDGHFTVAMAHVVAPSEVIALDIDETLLDAVDARADAAGLDNVTCVACDARELSAHVDGVVDMALLANTLHGASDRAGLLEDVADVLADDGRFAVVNWEDAPPSETPVLDEPRGPPAELRMTPAETRRAAEDAGFAVVRTVDLPPHHYGVVLRPPA